MYCLKQIHIQNFRNIEYQTIYLWERKSVFVGKNWSWKTIILKAIEKLINSKRIKRKDFKDLEKKLILEAIVIYKQEEIKIRIEAKFDSDEITTVDNFSDEKQKEFLKKVNLIFIPADRKINKENKEDWYIKLIDLILKTKELKNDKLVLKAREKLSNLKSRDWATKTTILISLLRLYLFSIQNFKSDDFTIFLIDQPENFLHPHATKMINEILQSIWEQENTKVCYATHSTELVSSFKKGKYEIDDIIFVKNENKKTITKRIDNKNWKYNKIMISLIFKNASIFFSDWVILVEWETEKISIPNIFENTDFSKYCDLKCKALTSYEKQNYFNLNFKNISVIDVWWKWALYEWFLFSSELFWKENVVAIIDRDENFQIDREMIIKSIKQVYRVDKIYENDFKKYNWVVLDWEFENYYKIEVIRDFLMETLRKRWEKYWEKFDNKKFQQSIDKLDINLERLKYSKKISVTYESIFSSYFRKYSKPTIAFNLSTWLCKNNWYDESLLKIFSQIIEKLDNQKN